MTDRSVADLAHQLWIARGRPEGSAEIDWFEAERLLGVPRAGGPQKEAAPSQNERVIDASLAATFPASDPPASHTPDLPPANAANKWAAAAADSHGEASAQAARKRAAAEAAAVRTRPRNRADEPPVDETDDAVAAAPGDIGEG